MSYSIREELATILIKEIEQIDPSVNRSEIVDAITTTPDIELGHFAFPGFILSKKFKKAPNQITQELKEKVPEEGPVARVVNVGPYLNFYVSGSAFGRILEGILSRDFFRQELVENPEKTMIEFSQPNTHKELHIGHLRNMCLGDALVKLFKYNGYDIISSTFPGDMGTHVAKCLWYMKYVNEEPAPEEEKGEWLGKMYSKGYLALEALKGTEKEEESKAQLSEILSQLLKKEGPFYDLWKETREWSIDLMQSVYGWLGISFDQWYWESELDESSVRLVLQNYDEGVFVKSQGAIGIDLSEYDLGFCVLIKSDGHGLYATKDIALAIRKFEDFHIEKSLYVVDMRQSHHFAQVFKCLELMGFEEAKNCYHLAYNYVELPEGPMSSRKGNIIPVMQLIDEMVGLVKRELELRYGSDWSETEKGEVAEKIAKGAIKYGMLRVGPSQKIVFKMSEWLDLSGNSGPYLQYTFARINSLCKKQGYDPSTPIDWDTLKEKEELAILVHLSEFNVTALMACQQYKVNVLCNYLQELAQLFNTFYAAHSIGQAETEAIKNARLGLSKAVAVTLEEGLALLGIAVPKRM